MKWLFFEIGRRCIRSVARAGIACAIACVPIWTLAQNKQSNVCGSLALRPGESGPFDYRTDRKEVEFIEGNHFQPQVEALVRGVSGTVGDELAFMLAVVPNHHRVLVALVRYGEKLKWAPAYGLRFSYDCYFERAMRFRPNDATVRLIYATYLNKVSRTREALQQLAYAADAAGDNGFTQYNVGLIYAEMKQYDLARAQAHKAWSLGFSRTELREQLMAAGKWHDPPSRPEPAGSEPKR